MSEYIPTTDEVRAAFKGGLGDFGEPFDRWLAEYTRIKQAEARGAALIEAVQAHRNLHMTYGSTSVCHGGIGGQTLTAHCGAICYNDQAHKSEVDAWHALESEAYEHSRARAAEIRERGGL